MNEKLTILSLIEILSALSCGIAIMYITYRILRIYGDKKLGIDQYNTAYLISIAAVLFAVGWILSGIINPILDYYRIASNGDTSALELFFSFILTGGIYIFIAYLFSLLIIASGIGLYTFMTPLKEVKEMKEDF